jgi:hypothetical protein
MGKEPLGEYVDASGRLWRVKCFVYSLVGRITPLRVSAKAQRDVFFSCGSFLSLFKI